MRLLYLKPEEIQKLIDNLEKEANGIKEHALKLCWFMRGGVTYQDILNMSVHERETVSSLIDENLETTKKSGLPFF